MIHRHAAADPQKGHFAFSRIAAAGEFAGAANATECGVQPQGHEDRRVDGRLAGRMGDGLDPCVKRRQIQALDVLPNDAGLMVFWQQIDPGEGAELDLLAVGPFGAWPWGAGALGGRSSSGGRANNRGESSPGGEEAGEVFIDPF